MRSLKLILSSILVFVLITSCQTRPHEALSVCVGIESDNPFIRNPCIKRPANSKIRKEIAQCEINKLLVFFEKNLI